MRLTLSLLLLIAIPALAFLELGLNDTDNGLSHMDTSVARFVDPGISRIAQSFNQCSHNSESNAGTYDPKSFDASQFKKAIVQSDVQRGCSYRRYSQSRLDAIKMFNSFLEAGRKRKGNSFDTSSAAAACYDKVESLDYSIQGLLNSNNTIAVFMSAYNALGAPQGPESEGNYSSECDYYELFILRKNGTVGRFVFNYTD